MRQHVIERVPHPALHERHVVAFVRNGLVDRRHEDDLNAGDGLAPVDDPTLDAERFVGLEVGRRPDAVVPQVRSGPETSEAVSRELVVAVQPPNSLLAALSTPASTAPRVM